jgi:hypothetical protein
MTEIEAVNLAKEYAVEWEIPWVSDVISDVQRHGWFLDIEWCTLTVDTGKGSAIVFIYGPDFCVNRFEYFPAEDDGLLLPLWAVFPIYTAVTMGWRQSYGEQYKYRWHAWYRNLPEERRAEYRRKYPPPEDDERAWKGFYELIADRPAAGEHPIAEFIMGQIP